MSRAEYKSGGLVSHARTQVVSAYLAADNPKAAFAYFEANKGDFTGKDSALIQQHVKAGMSTHLAETKVQAVMDAMEKYTGYYSA